MKVPAFMLKKLYVPGSLRADGDGFTFRLRNTLATATMTTPPELKLDGAVLNPSHIVAVVGGTTLTASDVSAAKPLAMTKGTEVEFRVKGSALKPGAHTITIKQESKEWGVMEFDVQDKV